MREQPPFLEDVSQPPLMRRQLTVGLRIQQHPVIQRHPTACRSQQAGDRVDDGGLAGAGTTEQHGDALGKRCGKPSGQQPGQRQHHHRRQHLLRTQRHHKDMLVTIGE